MEEYDVVLKNGKNKIFIRNICSDDKEKSDEALRKAAEVILGLKDNYTSHTENKEKL